MNQKQSVPGNGGIHQQRPCTNSASAVFAVLKPEHFEYRHSLSAPDPMVATEGIKAATVGVD